MSLTDVTAQGPEALLAGLDEQQRVAAEAVVGPVCVLAGAGTGKTRAITHRIAYGVATGAYTPQRVMALTFTSRAAAELRSRLRALGAGGVAARTFHAAALAQLSFFWPQVVGGTLPKLVESKGRMLGGAAESLRLKVDTATLRDLAAEIEWRKISNLSIEQYANRLGTRTLPGNLTAEQVIDLQRAYEQLKDDRRQLDFEDILLATAGMIESEPQVAMQVREQYRFFVVDEYQDVSPLQQELLDLWLGDRRDVCVVGDASQTIYSFAGASSEFLLGFEKRYPNAQVVRLEQNYRSAAPIVDTANALMRGRAGALTLRAAAAASASAPASSAAPAAASGDATWPEATAGATGAPTRQGGRPRGAIAPEVFPSDILEARDVAARIAAEIAAGTKPENIAVLYRMNVQSAVLESALSEQRISVRLPGSQRFFDRPEVRQAVMSLRAASVSIAGEPLFKSVSDVLRSLGWSQQPPEAPGEVRNRWESLNAIMGLVDEAPAGMTFRAFTDELLERQAGQHEPTMAAVTLATLHSAKGLEWESVYLTGVSEGLLPISYAVTREQIDEERRLFYVGITRARRALRISWAESGANRAQRRQASRFLAEIGSHTPGATSAGVR